MTAGLVDEFATAADETGAAVTRTAAAEAEAALSAAVDPPAVGAPLPFDGVSLPAGVETDPTPTEIRDAATGVTAVGLGVAAHGSVVVEPSPAGEDAFSTFPARHVAVVPASAVVADLSATLDHVATLAADGRDAVVVTGPSATADMGELVVGAHGPKELAVVLLEDR